ncbi:hypothetical protein H9Q74_007337 [Fusarium xylarioides]|nr:hypothetical protein H9Q71_010210 [Fusarium xylarioides]KAG5822565.1 hypothetical protein H9Q74_007337 [Fusarium xylarioides]
MDIAGLVISAATTFDAIFKVLEYIRIGRNFDDDFQDCLLRLDNAQLRLSRWGEAVKLTYVDNDTVSLRDTNLSAASLPKVEDRLKLILNDINDAKEKSEKFDQDDVFSPKSDLRTIVVPLHVKVKNLVNRRRSKLSTLELSQWAIFEKNHFEELIKRINYHTDELVKLFPPNEKEEKRLCQLEIAALCEGLAILQGCIGKQDETLAKTLNGILEPLAASAQTRIERAQIGVVNLDNGRLEQQLGDANFH